MATFILVHGTFANAADWPALQSGLAEEVSPPTDTARFEQVPWTGKNRASARQAAAKQIRSKVDEIRTHLPSEKIFIIGHSHGGNAIAYFLKTYPEVALEVTGCAFLSTPFVAIRARAGAIRPLLLVLLFMSAAPVTVWAEYALPRSIKNIADWPMQFWWGVAALAVLSLLLTLIAFRPYRSRDTIDAMLAKTILQQTTDIPTGNYLFLRCSGDEAAAALSAFQFNAWLAVKLSQKIEHLFRPLFSERPLVVMGFTAFAVILFYTAFRAAIPIASDLAEIGIVELFRQMGSWLTDGQILRVVVVILFLLLVFVIPIIFILSLLGTIAVFAAQALASWSFGWTEFRAGLLVELAIEPLPFGNYSLTHIDWASASAPDGITHSWTYEHPVAIARLRDWVQSGLS
ncbi:triacylglycerol lipase [Bradyrhizobium sp. CCBAU 051011]|uniref:esterase/lipase family protein n=1 Tax=Bradyrhizobium sp. CCBAU 051011 TaxID=858422 RepID=UPI00137A80DE|nr:alpha/beta fold hydrolase [Bradyrhizobium sp. CCBAU 051011]